MSLVAKNIDALSKDIRCNKIIFGKTFIIGHTLRKLSNLNANQIQLEENEIKKPFLNLLDNPEMYEITSVLSMADEEVNLELQ